MKQEKDAQNATIDAVNQIAMVPSNVLDGTSKYKKIFKSANIHRPNVPFHKHLENVFKIIFRRSTKPHQLTEKGQNARLDY